jgi:hypothetical protein
VYSSADANPRMEWDGMEWKANAARGSDMIA